MKRTPGKGLTARPEGQVAAIGVVAAVLLAFGLVVRAPAAQEPRRWVALDGRDWTQFAPGEKQAYVAGFLAGAASVAASSGDTAVTRTSVETRYRAGALQFPFGPIVYATQLDEFYWWDNHVPTPLYLALTNINLQLQKQRPAP
jgi:hypothetical protein